MVVVVTLEPMSKLLWRLLLGLASPHCRLSPVAMMLVQGDMLGLAEGGIELNLHAMPLEVLGGRMLDCPV